MRFVVLDASVAVKWYVRETGTEQAQALLDSKDLLFLAPDVFLPEVVNALLRQAGESQLTEGAVDRALWDLRISKPELVSSDQLIDRAVELARSIRHPLYDCLYLSLAERWDTVLVTAHLEFASRCRARIPLEAARVKLLSEFAP